MAKRRSTVPTGATASASQGRYTTGAGESASAAAGPVALVCYRELELNEITFWRSYSEAQEAVRELVPCSSACANAHVLVLLDAGRLRVEARPAVLPNCEGTH